MEALCNPTASVQPTEMVSLCLKALSTLLDDQWTRMRLGSDASLTIELLNVLHRYGILSAPLTVNAGPVTDRQTNS